ncbi:MAG TPA: type VI secretion system lipoprotein TssJ [Burkholderiaceae bacterium]|nr:type VI secretion system lipoprotein TssJ [Burkholderiaceae bacterium]
MHSIFRWTASLCIVSALSGCSVAPVLLTVADIALEKSGLKKPEKPEKPEVPEIQLPARQVAVRLHAGNNLNTDSNGHALALVARVYKLRDANSFNQAPFDAFLDAQKEKQALGNDLIEVREVTLVPGQRYEVMEKVPRDVAYIGVIALFRAPAPTRWRYVFESAEAEKTGITLGVLSCAMTVASANAAGVDRELQQSLIPVRCG